MIKIKINEIFEGIQGEGNYNGTPVIIIRLSGCTRSCTFCDSKFHKEYKRMDYEEILKQIRKSKIKIILWTGGEPLLYKNEIYDIKKLLGKEYSHHLETNGDLLEMKDIDYKIGFQYIACSPKDVKTAKKVRKLYKKTYGKNGIDGVGDDIKVVTDLELNKNLIPYATCLMPLTKVYDKIDVTKNTCFDKNKQIQQKVWQYCVKHNIKYSPRLHIDVFGTEKRGV